jgi:hypothetical protein
MMTSRFLWKASFKVEYNNGSYIQRMEGTGYFLTMEDSLSNLLVEANRPYMHVNGKPEIVSAEYLGKVTVPLLPVPDQSGAEGVC